MRSEDDVWQRSLQGSKRVSLGGRPPREIQLCGAIDGEIGLSSLDSTCRQPARFWNYQDLTIRRCSGFGTRPCQTLKKRELSDRRHPDAVPSFFTRLAARMKTAETPRTQRLRGDLRRSALVHGLVTCRHPDAVPRFLRVWRGA